MELQKRPNTNSAHRVKYDIAWFIPPGQFIFLTMSPLPWSSSMMLRLGNSLSRDEEVPGSNPGGGLSFCTFIRQTLFPVTQRTCSMNLQPVPPPRSFDPRTLMADQHSHIPVRAYAEVAPQSLPVWRKNFLDAYFVL